MSHGVILMSKVEESGTKVDSSWTTDQEDRGMMEIDNHLQRKEQQDIKKF